MKQCEMLIRTEVSFASCLNEWFPEIGVPPNHPFLFGIFPEVNHPAMGGPPIDGTPHVRVQPSFVVTLQGLEFPPGAEVTWTPAVRAKSLAMSGAAGLNRP